MEKMLKTLRKTSSPSPLSIKKGEARYQILYIIHVQLHKLVFFLRNFQQIINSMRFNTIRESNFITAKQFTPETPAAEQKSCFRQKFVMHKEVYSFNFREEQTNISQLALMIVKLQKEVKKLKIQNEKLILKLVQKEKKVEQNESRLMVLEKEMDVIWNLQQNQTWQIIQLAVRVQKQEDKPQKTELSETRAIQMEIQANEKETIQRKQLKQRSASTVEARDIYIRNDGNSKKNKSKSNTKRKKKKPE